MVGGVSSHPCLSFSTHRGIKVSTYQLDLDHKEFARILDALDTQARALHASINDARAAGFDDIAQGLYADAVGFEVLAHRLAHMPSLDDVLRMLQGVSQ
jgi:hypothetical protein